MTGKQQRKLRKRTHIAAVIATQNAWLEQYGLEPTANRRVRDHRFGAAQRLSLILQGIPHVMA